MATFAVMAIEGSHMFITSISALRLPYPTLNYNAEYPYYRLHSLVHRLGRLLIVTVHSYYDIYMARIRCKSTERRKPDIK